MSEESIDRKKPVTQREAARLFFSRLEQLSMEVEIETTEAYTNDKPPPSAIVAALVGDASSLLQGISEGWINVSQPRIVTDLIQVVAELDKTQHTVLAAEFSLLVGGLSDLGLGAEGCQLGHNRMRPNGLPENTTLS